MALPPFKYPVLGFLRDETQEDFFRDDDLAYIYTRPLKEGRYENMLLVDMDGRAWAVRHIKVLGLDGSLPERIVCTLICRDARRYRVEYELDEVEPPAIDEIKRRVRRSIDVAPAKWFSASDPDYEAKIEAFKAEISRTRSIADIIDVFCTKEI